MSSTKLSPETTLLSQVARIADHQEELIALTGESFNIFSILGLESAENRTHSAFIAELLNPKGSHKMGTTFIQLFIETINLDVEFDRASADVFCEYYIGPRNDTTRTGGRIDILLKDGNNRLITIENKIYASDQDYQVERYCNYEPSNNTVFYLTLNGDPPTDESKGDKQENEDYFLLSYHDDILQWLELCQKEAVATETIRTGIGQYITLIKNLTNQNNNSRMSSEIIDLISQNYQAARHISSHMENAEKAMVQKVLEEVKTALSSELDSEWTFEIVAIDQRYGGLDLSHPKLGKNVSIRLEGQSYIWKHPSIIGIRANKNDSDRGTLTQKLGGLDFFNSKIQEGNHWWYAYKNFVNWNIAENREALFTENGFHKAVSSITEGFTTLISEVMPKLEVK